MHDVKNFLNVDIEKSIMFGISKTTAKINNYTVWLTYYSKKIVTYHSFK